MYFNTGQRLGGGLSLPPTHRFGAAVAVPVAGAVTIAMVLEAIALVVSAAAAAYLLVKAYEAAQARGFGVALARRALSAGLGRLLDMASRMAELLRRFLERVKRGLGNRPECQSAFFALVRALAELERLIAELAAEARKPVPLVPELRRLMTATRRKALEAARLMKALQACL